jgi:hypothetical protein
MFCLALIFAVLAVYFASFRGQFYKHELYRDYAIAACFALLAVCALLAELRS